MKIKLLVFSLITLIVVAFSFPYYELWKEGNKTYYFESSKVNTLVNQYPVFFETIFDSVFDYAMTCEAEKSLCIKETRKHLDFLSDEIFALCDEPGRPCNTHDFIPLNSRPFYFIKPLSDETLAKLFFSGDLIIEKVDTREEKMVIKLLKEERKDLYGPYYDKEAFPTPTDGPRFFLDPKPAYLKDLYSQMEVIVPYKHNGKVVGAIVYLHGE